MNLQKLFRSGLMVVLGAAPLVAEGADAARTAPEVVVSASRVPVPAEEVGSAVTVITAKELARRQIRVVSDALRAVPGLAVSRSGPIGSVTQVRIRGAEANHTLVLIDGIEVNNPATGSEFFFDHLLSAGVARIEILRGPQSALYGSDAIGGVINIITKRPGSGWSATARAEAGSHATWDGLGQVGYGSDRFYVTGLINRLDTNGISVADERNGNTEPDPYANTTARLKAGAEVLPNLELEAVGMLVNASRAEDSFTNPVGILLDTGDTSETRQRYGLVKARYTLLDGAWEHILRASHAANGTDYFDAGGNETFISKGDRTKYEYQTNLTFDTPGFADAEHTVTLAAEHEREHMFTDGSFSDPNSVAVESSGYVGEYRLGLWDSLFLSGSLRYDDNDPLFPDQVTWRGTAAWLVAPWQTRLHASIGRGVKNPTLFELFGSTPTFTGNPDLEPEESIGWDAGIEKTFLDGDLVTDVTYFHNRFRNFIDGSGPTARNLPGSVRAQGIELTVTATPTAQLTLNASYTYTATRDADGNQLIRRPRHAADIDANYRFDLWQRPADLNLNLRYNGDQTDTAFGSTFPGFERTVELDGYTLLGLALSWHATDRMTLFLRGENLLDQHYEEVYGYGTAGATAFVGVQFKLGPSGT